MDSKAIPIVAANASLQSAWELMQDVGRSGVLVQRGTRFFVYTDEDVAKGIVASVKTFSKAATRGRPIDLLKPTDFSKKLRAMRRQVDRRGIQDRVESAYQQVLGLSPAPADTGNVLWPIVEEAMEKAGTSLAVVGIQFDLALLYSRSEESLRRAGMAGHGPGFYVCQCEPTHTLQPKELHDRRCPYDHCEVEFSR